MNAFVCRLARGRKTNFWLALQLSCDMPVTGLMLSQKTIGSWNLVQLEDGLEGMSLRLLTQVLGWQLEEVHVLLANVRKDFRDPKVHAQLDL